MPVGGDDEGDGSSMSETLSQQDPESLGSAAGYATSYPPTPATPSSTVQDAAAPATSSLVNLPPFSTFAADMDAGGGGGFVSDRLFAQ